MKTAPVAAALATAPELPKKDDAVVGTLTGECAATNTDLTLQVHPQARTKDNLRRIYSSI